MTTRQKIEIYGEKFFDMPFIIHFFSFWLSIFLVVSAFMWSPMGGHTAIKFSLLVGIPISLGLSGMLGLGKMTMKFSAKLNALEEKYKTITNREDMIAFRKEVYDFYKKEATVRQWAEPVKILRAKIDTYLQVTNQRDFMCQCGYGCNTLDSLSRHKSECYTNKRD